MTKKPKKFTSIKFTSIKVWAYLQLPFSGRIFQGGLFELLDLFGFSFRTIFWTTFRSGQTDGSSPDHPGRTDGPRPSGPPGTDGRPKKALRKVSFTMFCYFLLCFTLFAMFCYVLLCFCYVLLCFAMFLLCFCYVLLCFVMFCYVLRVGVMGSDSTGEVFLEPMTPICCPFGASVQNIGKHSKT